MDPQAARTSSAVIRCFSSARASNNGCAAGEKAPKAVPTTGRNTSLPLASTFSLYSKFFCCSRFPTWSNVVGRVVVGVLWRSHSVVEEEVREDKSFAAGFLWFLVVVTIRGAVVKVFCYEDRSFPSQKGPAAVLFSSLPLLLSPSSPSSPSLPFLVDRFVGVVVCLSTATVQKEKSKSKIQTVLH
jgi:hypothetical protein